MNPDPWSQLSDQMQTLYTEIKVYTSVTFIAALWWLLVSTLVIVTCVKVLTHIRRMEKRWAHYDAKRALYSEPTMPTQTQDTQPYGR